ncbi:S8 family peptidase [Flagellimonas halotolerans]|uniref:S8 family peptidase n=1 Tax=Flagellimonas halotolerans TaxID=3112164 RepID=A0ABU6ILB7_9FLAO|nr:MULTISPECIES: S8 family peptidase [unclassified Allomuricauda]MEC3963917.1 S8 family peptidase [Muricauda sp. SYSU M86414]MEC4263787.1 S8 family peptidase [Muricauda sp. SYSU M84420]
MNRTYNKLSFLSLSAALFLMGCGSTALVSTPVENIDAVPLKISELTEAEKKNWGHLDLIADTIPGMSVDKAYNEIIKNKKGKTVVVAVLDSGMDLEHEDLKSVLWTNTDEIPNNNKDDDGNGYVDDIHGYNFLGESYNEQLEYVRMLRLNIGDASERAEARLLLDKEYPEAVQNKQQYEQIFQVVKGADELVRNELGKETYTKEDLLSIEPKTTQMEQSVAVLTQMFTYGDSIPEVLDELQEGIKYFSEQANYNLNKDFNGRTPVGDDPYDITDVPYGNGNPKNIVDTESHGTHVAGIIAAKRNNGIGVDGVAQNVEIMSIRAVPNGDEYDKDIALGIRYAVDNGASIINCSFGKSFSPKAEWVYDAIKYAASKDVLIVHAAGNDGEDLESPENRNYPNDDMDESQEFVDNMITVGALSSSYGSEMVASFSNYGNQRVDVFAPGAEIYSTMPNSEYEFQGGTSMAAPAVAGVAALIRSFHPDLSASQVKNIIMQSGLRTKRPVIVAGDETKTTTFDKISKSGKMVNAYNALILANNISKGKMTLESNSK